MKRAYSLKGRKSYNSVFLKGRKKRGKGVIIFVLKRNKSEKLDRRQTDFRDIRIGISVSKRIGKAYKRNWIKRRIKAVCYELIEQMNEGFSIIIKPGPESLDMSFEELRSDIVTVFKHAGVINESG